MNEPRFAVLDVVEIGGDPALAEQGLSGRRGAIVQIRRYPDGLIRYSVGSLTDEDDGVGGLYDEEDLRDVGERVSIDRFRIPGPFREREIVVISEDCDEPKIAGRRGEILGGAYSHTDSGDLELDVWVEELGEVFVVDSRSLVATGERRPLPAAGRTARSTRVSEDGDILGSTGYVNVDDIERYL
jgi:hypothetical protein